MAKPFTPRLIRLNEEANNLIPEALKKNLRNNMAYAVMPESNDNVVISDAPDAKGRLCAFIPKDLVETMAKATPKSPKINVRVTMPDGTTSIMTVGVPENIMDEDIQYIIQIAADCVKETHTEIQSIMFDLMLEHLNDHTPLTAAAMVTDLDVSLT